MPKQNLTSRIEAFLTTRGVNFETKRMMGGVAFMVDGKMLVGATRERLMVRFDPAQHDDVLDRPGARPMDFTGRVMRGYVFVNPKALSREAPLISWLELALAFNPRAKSSRQRAAAAATKRKR